MPKPSEFLAVTADVERFREAEEAFWKRYAITPEQLSALGKYAHDRAFTYAGASQLSVVKEVRKSLMNLIQNGGDFEQWKKDNRAKILKDWGTYRPREGAGRRIDLILGNAIQKSHSAGRWQQLTAPHVAEMRPFWMFDAVLDSHTSDICESRGQPPVVLPANDPWWTFNWPPLHHGPCRSGVRALRPSQAAARGISRMPPVDDLKSWGATPDLEQPWTPTDVPPDAAAAWHQKQQQKPPRPTNALEIGRHIRKLESTLDELASRRVMSILSEKGLTDALASHPLDKLTIAKQLPQFNAGLWQGKVQAGALLESKVSLATERTFGSAWAAGKTWALSEAEPSVLDSMRATLLHEVGHHFGNKSNSIREKIRAGFKRRVGITEYARQSSDEWFAESFAAYFLRPADLREFDPNGYSTVEWVLSQLGALTLAIP